MELCLFCDRNTRNFKPYDNCLFICGTCVVLLVTADQEDLQKAYVKAVKKGLYRKSSAIESFLTDKEGNYGKEKL